MYESLVTKVLRRVLDLSRVPLRVIEIGTAYGEHLYQLKGCQNLLEIVSIDPMYDWVPDLRPDDRFDRSFVDDRKVRSWHDNVRDLDVPVSLLIAKSKDAALNNMLPHSDFDVLVIDGCHHPVEAVEDDYWDFVSYLKRDHIVIFDDINHCDPGIAADNVVTRLRDADIDLEVEDHEGGKVRVLRIRHRD